jgi:hypothetical protein
MDFDKFIEKDILEFLDQQAMLIAEKAAGLREEEFDLYEITKDYSKEISEALKEGDLRKAQKIFEDVKSRYLKAPEISLSKKRLYTIMEEIYERIKDYESKEDGKSLFETIKDYEEKGFFTRPELFEGKEIAGVNLILSSIAGKEKELERITNKKPFQREDLQRAVNNYRVLKELIKRLPESSRREKEKVYDAALSWYYTIKKLKEALDAEDENKKKEAIAKETNIQDERNVEEVFAEVRKLKSQIVESHNKIANYIKNKDLNNSIEEYRQLRSLIDAFPQEMEEEKTALLADALSLHESIKKLKESLGPQQGVTESDEEEKEEKAGNKELRKEINRALQRVKALLAAKDSTNAIKEYAALRELFEKYPEQPLEEKKQLYDQIISAHKDLVLLEEDLKRKNSTGIDETVSDITKNLEEANKLLDKGSAEDATHMLLEAKHRIQMLPQEAFDDKYALLREVEKLDHKLLFVKNVQKLVAPIPPHGEE